jgi:hypothetical protein
VSGCCPTAIGASRVCRGLPRTTLGSRSGLLAFPGLPIGPCSALVATRLSLPATYTVAVEAVRAELG